MFQELSPQLQAARVAPFHQGRQQRENVRLYERGQQGDQNGS